MENYNKIQKGLKEHEALFFIDAVHPQHNTHTAKAWLSKGSNTYTLTK